jgi:hypothetical protein
VTVKLQIKELSMIKSPIINVGEINCERASFSHVHVDNLLLEQFGKIVSELHYDMFS